MHFKEIETKYDGSGISMKSFTDFVEALKPDKELFCSSYDDYYVNSTDFVRYRYSKKDGGRAELTIKKKTSDKNNNARIEVNIPTQDNNTKGVSAFMDLLGYKYNFGIYKTCQIYWLDRVVVVYYVVYDKELKELRRFIEIEADEDCTWTSEEEAWAQVVKYETMFEPLGITHKNRLKKSMFEMFRKE
jgi:adenylate cyclase class IV